MQRIIAEGRLAADAEVRELQNGRQVVNFRMAVDVRERGEKKTYWHRVSCFNNQALTMAKYLTKGKPVIVIGQYSNNIYQSQNGPMIDNGITADSIDFVSGSENPNGQNEQNGQAAPQQQPTAFPQQYVAVRQPAATQSAPKAAPAPAHQPAPSPAPAAAPAPQSSGAADDPADDLPF